MNRPGTYEWALQPSDISGHVSTLRWLATLHDRVIEFGVRKGVSTAAFRAADPSTLISYDIASAPSWLPPSHDFRRQNVLEIGPVSCDMLFIDTVHTYEQLSAELARHAEGVTCSIVLHDTHIPKELWEPDVNDPEGMWVAINEFVGNSPWAVVLDVSACNGLTVLARGRSVHG